MEIGGCPPKKVKSFIFYLSILCLLKCSKVGDFLLKLLALTFTSILCKSFPVSAVSNTHGKTLELCFSTNSLLHICLFMCRKQGKDGHFNFFF